MAVMVKATEEFSNFALSSHFSCKRGNVGNFMSVVKSNFPFVVNSVLANFSDWLRNVFINPKSVQVCKLSKSLVMSYSSYIWLVCVMGKI